jgi:hypothetical protein
MRDFGQSISAKREHPGRCERQAIRVGGVRAPRRVQATTVDLSWRTEIAHEEVRYYHQRTVVNRAHQRHEPWPLIYVNRHGMFEVFAPPLSIHPEERRPV